jgi:D-serine deaminase-like pyridoxal phosphate-dependent protein
MQLHELETPCLILDRRRLEKNLATMRQQAQRLGVRLRPHGKTAKNIDIVRMALGSRPEGITVSTLKEARYYFENGITDILYAVGIAPVKLKRAAALIKDGADLTLILDTPEQARCVAAAGRSEGVAFPVLIEIDCDNHRAGVTPEDPLLLAIGRLLGAEPGAALRGVMTHAGASYGSRSAEEIRSFARRERDAVVRCAERLRAAGLPCPVVSVGSTPTARFADDLSGVTEARPGVYMSHDLVMAGLGVCGTDDIALSVLASVIGRQTKKGWLIVDAGWTALSRDRGTAAQALDQGYGLVCGIDGRSVGDLIVADTNQEHGIIAHRQGAPPDFDAFPIGSAVRILPNHACATAAMHDRYFVVDGDTAVAAVWPRINGW